MTVLDRSEPGPNARILVLDFDGVLHSYVSGWKGADICPDDPVPGAMEFLVHASGVFRIMIYSSRSHQAGGIEAMRQWISDHLWKYLEGDLKCGPSTGRNHDLVLGRISFPLSKPSAFVTLDDRAITFNGTWPKIADLLDFKPWNKRGDETPNGAGFFWFHHNGAPADEWTIIEVWQNTDIGPADLYGSEFGKTYAQRLDDLVELGTFGGRIRRD